MINAKTMIDLLRACCESGDDHQMLAVIKELAINRENRLDTGAILLAALELRPNWGPELDPKAWREEVKSCLWQLYEIAQLRTSLTVTGDPIAERLDSYLGDLFDQPLAIIDPVLENHVSFDDYLPVACKAIEAILDACQHHVAEPDDIDQRLGDIETLDMVVSDLERCMKQDSGRHELKQVARQIRGLFDNPEVNLWRN